MIKKYEYFILENNRIDTITLSEDEFNLLLNKHCKEFSFDDKPIYRGVDLSETYYKIDPKLYTRKSRSTSNYYTLLMSKWDNIPARNKSLICSLDKNMAKGYGNFFRVIPFDNSEWGVSKVWIKQIYDFNLMWFNDALYDFFEDNDIGPNDDNYDDFIKQLQKFTVDDFIKQLQKFTVDDFYKHIENDSFLKDLKIKMINKTESLDEFILNLITPNENILSCSYKDIPKTSIELWTDSTCLLQKLK